MRQRAEVPGNTGHHPVLVRHRPNDRGLIPFQPLDHRLYLLQPPVLPQIINNPYFYGAPVQVRMGFLALFVLCPSNVLSVDGEDQGVVDDVVLCEEIEGFGEVGEDVAGCHQGL